MLDRRPQLSVHLRNPVNWRTEQTRTFATILLPNSVARLNTRLNEGAADAGKDQAFQFDLASGKTEQYQYNRISRPVP
jgi:hypothetical protein